MKARYVYGKNNLVSFQAHKQMHGYQTQNKPLTSKCVELVSTIFILWNNVTYDKF